MRLCRLFPGCSPWIAKRSAAVLSSAFPQRAWQRITRKSTTPCSAVALHRRFGGAPGGWGAAILTSFPPYPKHSRLLRAFAGEYWAVSAGSEADDRLRANDAYRV